MKIAIYETVHLDWVIPYAELMAQEDVTVSFITSLMFKDDLENILAEKNPRFTWHFLDPASGFIAFSKKLHSIFKSNDFDLLVLNSADSRLLILFMVLRLNKPKKILINLHDINNFFKIKLSLSFKKNIRSMGKKSLMLLTDGYIVNAETMKRYILKNKLTPKPVYWLQPVYYNGSFSNKKAISDKKIVVPGSIDPRRRDYYLVLDMIHEMLRNHVQVSWVLAGRPVYDYGFKIINKAKELNTKGADITFFTEDVPENQFQQIIAASTLILSPLVSSSAIHDNIAEIYGESKGSGNIYDAIRHAKPLIVPAAVKVPEQITSSCITYQSKDDLAKQLFTVLTDDSILKDYQQKAEKNVQFFSKEKIKDMFIAVFRKASF